MDTLQRTKDILAAAEKSLASLASEAAKGTEYDEASVLIELAREVNSLAARAMQQLRNNTTAQTPALVIQTSNGLARKTKPKRDSYPKFSRQGDDLVKIGWSPSENSEYEHKSPKKVLQLLAAAVTKVGANGKRFTMDRVMPLQNDNGAHIPDYQVYLCLAWIRELGFVVQHGRQGYSLASRAPIEPLLESHWSNLPAR